MIVTDGRVVDYVAQRCQTAFVPPFTAMGIESEGRIVAGVIFNCYTGPDIEVTVASEPKAITRSFIREVGRYVFETTGCIRMSVTTDQPHVIDLAKRLGGQTEGRKRNLYGPGRHGIMLGILRENWTY